jgi:tripartite-type tricarboxylate transporter receptor subunit TctC
MEMSLRGAGQRDAAIPWRTLSVAVAALSLTFASAAAFPQSYPNKPIRVVTSAPGGGNDFTARAIAYSISGSLGQPWVVDNRGGAGGAIAAELVARAPPDGYTLLVYASNIWIIPLLRSVPYDPVKDLAPITWAARSPNTVVVHPSLPVKSLKELIALAKARPGQLMYGSAGTGATSHLSAELFKSMAKVDVLRVPYKANAPALNDLLSGQVQLMFSTASSVTPHVRSGRLRALAVTSAEPTPLAPGLPTVAAAAGLPGYESISIYGVFAPAKTPEAIIRQLNQSIVAVLSQPDVREKFLNVGVETVGSTPEQFAAVIKADMARMSKVIKEAGIRE